MPATTVIKVDGVRYQYKFFADNDPLKVII
jgi:hypothetical protein